jgi:hypothetical protein
VARWLTAQIDDNLKERIILEPIDLTYADDVYEVILRLVGEAQPTASSDAFYRVER